MSPAPNMLKAAGAYASRLNWPVIPVYSIIGRGCSCGVADCSSPGKHPRTRHGLHDATKDAAQIGKWWRRGQETNIAIPTGEASGFFALDVDPRHGGHEALQELERRHGALPHTARQITGSGGEHVLFRHVPGVRNSVGKLGPGLDIRAEGGFIVVAPSLHLSGRRYAWSVDHHPIETAVAVAPQWLLGLICEPAGLPHGHTPAPTEEWIDALSQPCEEGRRNATLTRISGYLLRHYVAPFAVLELVRLWNLARCQPPLDDDEVFRTVDSICAKEAKRREDTDG